MILPPLLGSLYLVVGLDRACSRLTFAVDKERGGLVADSPLALPL